MEDLELIKLGQKIKFERKKRDLSQEKLAELSGISVHGISNIETGKTDVKYSNLLALSKAFGLEIYELLHFYL